MKNLQSARFSGGLSLLITSEYWLDYYWDLYKYAGIGYPYGYTGFFVAMLIAIATGIYALIASKNALWLIPVVAALATLLFGMSKLH